MGGEGEERNKEKIIALNISHCQKERYIAYCRRFLHAILTPFFIFLGEKKKKKSSRMRKSSAIKEEKKQRERAFYLNPNETVIYYVRNRWQILQRMNEKKKVNAG